MIARTLGALLALLLCGPASAQAPPAGPALEHPEAFEQAYAISTYMFDACGDPLAGRMFRRALAERFAQCPFTPEARSRFQRRTRIQQAKSRQIMEELIETHGGLPVQLEGMSRTCHEQQADAGYRAFRERLDQYTQGGLAAGAVIAAPCDASEIMP